MATSLSTSEFLVLDGIKGESLDDKHKGEIEVLSVDFLKIDRLLGDFGNDVLSGGTDHKGGGRPYSSSSMTRS